MTSQMTLHLQNNATICTIDYFPMRTKNIDLADDQHLEGNNEKCQLNKCLS